MGRRAPREGPRAKAPGARQPKRVPAANATACDTTRGEGRAQTPDLPEGAAQARRSIREASSKPDQLHRLDQIGVEREAARVTSFVVGQAEHVGWEGSRIAREG